MVKFRQNKQTSLFPGETNLVSREDYKKMSTKRKQHEKKYMQDIIKAAYSMGLPCFHIEYYCGNKFYARCSCKQSQDSVIICPCCHKPVLVECHNTLNKGLSGHFDIIGIGWAIETKHKINKGKQVAKGSDRQETKKELYEKMGIPNLILNEDDNQEALTFLLKMREKYVMDEKTHTNESIFKVFFRAKNLLIKLFKSTSVLIEKDFHSEIECFLKSIENIVPGKQVE